MKLVAVSRVRNEVDIIEPFVRHHAAYFDKIIVLDDGSNDGTFEILHKLQQEKLPLVLLQEPAVGYDQSRYMTRLLRLAVHQFGADWIVPLDADEFIEPEAGKTLVQILERHQYQLFSIPWHNFEWRSENDTDPEPNPVVRQRFRLPAQADLNKLLIPKSLILEKTVISQGNHQLLHEGQASFGLPLQSLALCHFPIRSAIQYASKVAIGYLQYLSMPDWDRHNGFQYIEPFKVLLAGGVDALKLRMADDSRYYSIMEEQRGGIVSEARDEPLRYRGGSVKYTVSASTLLENVLHCADAIARDRAKMAHRGVSAGDGLEGEAPGDPSLCLSTLQRQLTTVRRELVRSIEDKSLLAKQLADAQGALAELKQIPSARLRRRALFDFLQGLWRR